MRGVWRFRSGALLQLRRRVGLLHDVRPEGQSAGQRRLDPRSSHHPKPQPDPQSSILAPPPALAQLPVLGPRTTLSTSPTLNPRGLWASSLKSHSQTPSIRYAPTHPPTHPRPTHDPSIPPPHSPPHTNTDTALIRTDLNWPPCDTHTHMHMHHARRSSARGARALGGSSAGHASTLIKWTRTTSARSGRR